MPLSEAKHMTPVMSCEYSISQVGDEYVFMPLSVETQSKVGIMNETGAFIMKRINGTNSIDEIVNDLVSEYDTDYDNALNDVLSVVSDLIAMNICRLI